MKNIILSTILVVACIPFSASAHATPLESIPAASSRVRDVPQEVVIRFSERLDEGASVIQVKDSLGTQVSSGPSRVSDEDSRVLSVSVNAENPGPYIVTWSVVSSDDGHFTRGSFPFLVGEGVLPAVSATDLEIVQITTAPEAFTMSVELFGNGLLWATIILYALAIRPLLAIASYADTTSSFRRGYAYAIVSGVIFALLGAASQIGIKSSELAALHSIALYDAVWMYAGTTAGSATVVRMCLVLTVALVAAFSLGRIIRSRSLTLNEITMMVILVLFASARAVVSHATANPFLPELSVAINVVHLIEKDVWAGILAILTVMLLSKKIAPMMGQIVERVYKLLSINLILIVITASYIVWLHLKSFENLFSTKWGTVFLQLFLAAALLVALRAYHVVARATRPRLFGEILPLTTAAEFGAALLVLYFSSVVIITSPPLSLSHGPVFSEHSQGIDIEMQASPYQDDAMLITLDGGAPQTPDVEIRGDGDSLSVPVEARFDGGYVFPKGLLSGSQKEVHIRVPQEDAYDATARFVVAADAYKGDGERSRKLDGFTLAMIMIALAGALSAVGLHRFLRADRPFLHTGRHVIPVLYVGAGLFCALFFGGAAAMLIANPRIANPYRYVCESDGNMWHLMLPTKAGVPVSETPREGCMWGMGAYPYMFPDAREYDYVRSFERAQVSLAFENESLFAGAPQRFTVAIKKPDGSPANLFVDMEKYVHVVIVSADQTVFAHVHPDDARPLTQEEMDTATFNLSYIFPKGGEYLVSIDYANGITLENHQERVSVKGPTQLTEPQLYTSPARIDDYDVSLSYPQPFAGAVSTFRYEIRTEGEFARLEPYLSAAMHIAVVKNDLSAFIHTHGEYHPPGTEIPPIIVRDGTILHSMAAMYTPAQFSGPLDAHVIFPEPGLYTVWAQFKGDGVVHAAPFTVRVE